MNSKSVLLVEDSEIDQFIAKSILENIDGIAEIHTAFDGEEALEVLQNMSNPPDYIFLDINMPRMNGIEFLKHYNEQSEKSKVCILTSSTRDEDKNSCMAYDFVVKYFVKPLDQTTVEAILLS